MESEFAANVDEVDRFTAIREESLELIESTRTLVAEMRVLLDECKRWRPVVPREEHATSVASPRPTKKRPAGRGIPRGRHGRVAKPK
jgi:hypothetical protein